MLNPNNTAIRIHLLELKRGWTDRRPTKQTVTHFLMLLENVNKAMTLRFNSSKDLTLFFMKVK